MKLSFSNHKPRAPHHPQDTFSSRILNDAYLDWAIMFVGTIVLGAILVLLGYLAYIEVQTRLSAPPEAPVPIRSIFKEEALIKTIKSFDQRAVERSAIIQGEVRMSDPSI